MMTINKSILLSMAFAALLSCQQEKETATETTKTEAAVQQLTFRTETVTKKAANCVDTSALCTTVTLQYAVASGQPTALRDSLNAYIQQHLLSLQLDLNPDADTTNQGDAAQATAAYFLSQYETYAAAFSGTDTPNPWEITVEIKPVHQTSKLVSLQADTYTYTGGAHPLATTRLQSFDSTGNRLSIAMLVTDTTALRNLAEQEFRKVKAVPANQTLKEAGLFVEHLPLPQNGALTAEGLLLYYNPYEVAAYAFGATKLLLPYAQLKTLLKPAYQP